MFLRGERGAYAPLFLFTWISQNDKILIMKVKTLIVGLGNPGEKYEKTRHNAGFMVLDVLCNNFKFEKKFNAEVCRLSSCHSREDGNLDSEQARMTNEGDIILMKPQTFMNLSGEAVQSFAGYYKIQPGNIWIIHDDIDIPFGEIRVKKGGSSAGHKGVQSIIEKMGTEDFWRFRVGVKNNDLARIETEDFVLQRFNPDEAGVLDKIINLAADEIKLFLKEGTLEAKTLKLNKK